MKFLSYGYRFLSNFVFLALVYYSLNFMDKYNQRAIIAILVLVYAAMRAASSLRSFYFFQRISGWNLRRAVLRAWSQPGLLPQLRGSRSSATSLCCAMQAR